MKEQLEAIRKQALEAVAGPQASADLEAVRVQSLGKKGELTAVLKQMGKPSPPFWRRRPWRPSWRPRPWT